MDAEKLDAMRTAAAARGTRGIDRTSTARFKDVTKASKSRRSDRSGRSTRSFEAVVRKGGRSGEHRTLDTETE